MTIRQGALIAAAAVLVATSCGGEGGGQKGLCPEPASGGPVALFDLFNPTGEELAPFPTDLKTVADPSSPTGLRLDYARSMFRDGLNVLDGASLQSVLFVPFARSVDPASLPSTPAESTADGSSLFLLDIEGLGETETGTLATRKLPVETGVVHDGNSIFMPMIRNAIAARPAERLEPGHAYALVTTACVTSPDGAGLGTQEGFADLRDGGVAPEGANPDAAQDLSRVIAYLEREGYLRGDLAMVTTFTTQMPKHVLTAAREVFEGLDAPDPVVTHVFDAAGTDGSVHPDLMDHIEDPDIDGDPADLLSEFDLSTYRFDRIDKVVYGTFEAPSFLDEEEMFALDGTWTPVIQGSETLDFLLTLPREDTASGIAPPYRVLVYQHAMTVCKETILALADTMARFGIAVIGIDTVKHGSRHPDEPGTCSLDFGTFMYIDNFSRSNSYFMQTVVDIWSLVAMLQRGDAIDVLPGPGDGTADLDVARLAFAGQSMGSSMGMDAMALEPAFGAGVVNVGAGSMMNLMLSMSLDLPDDPVPALSEYGLYEMGMGAVVPAMADRGDPLTWAFHLIQDPVTPARTEPLSLLYQQAAYDEILPFESAAVTARAMGIPGVAPAFRPVEGLTEVSTPVSENLGGLTAALFQYDRPAEHQFLLTCEDPSIMFAGQLQLAVFVGTHLGGGPAVIIDPFDEAQVAAHAPGWEPWTP